MNSERQLLRRSSIAEDHPDPNGMVIEQLRGIAKAREVEQIQMKIWGSNEAWIVPAHVLYIVSDYGGILLGARVDGVLAGFVIGFLARQDGELFHASHMLGVLPNLQQRGIGAALKRCQRDEALSQGLDLMTWTFDPLEARNAYFNLHKLGTTSRVYREDYYGPMQDALNRDLPSDRLLVRWDLRDDVSRPSSEREWVSATPQAILSNRDSTPELRLDDRIPDRPVAIEIPRDIQALKHESPALALAWRLAVRRAFAATLGLGFEARDFQNGAYILYPSRDASG